MISRLPASILYEHGLRVLTVAKPTSHSWFLKIRDICLQYSLPHPVNILKNPPTKESFKRFVRAKVQDYWQEKLRQQASSLTSLKFFRPSFMSLSKPHPLWTTSKSNPYEVNKCIVQAKILFGQYRTKVVCRIW